MDFNTDEFSDGLNDVSNLLGELSSWGNDESLSVDWGSINDL